MNVKIKLAAYAVLVILAIVFGSLFYSNYSAVTKAAADDSTPAAPTPPPPPPPMAATNVSTNTVAQTNAVSSDTNAVVSTNQTAAATNAVAPTPPPTPKAAPPPPPEKTGKKGGSMIGYLAAFVVVLIGLGLLIAADVTAYMGSQTVDFLFDDKGVGARDPAYENAEQIWAQGKHLEAIQMMREYLRDHPREQYVALRIAEIYEKDLRNFLAAALEIEEVLKQKLPADRWGWTAIHLCNIYTKMGQQDKTLVLLQKIVDDYPKTAAAKKARSRLGIAEPESAAPAAAVEEEVPDVNPEAVKRVKLDVPQGPVAYKKRGEEEPEEPSEPEEPPPPPPPKSNLPPGFRPK